MLVSGSPTLLIGVSVLKPGGPPKFEGGSSMLGISPTLPTGLTFGGEVKTRAPEVSISVSAFGAFPMPKLVPTLN